MVETSISLRALIVVVLNSYTVILAPPITKMKLQQWNYSQKIWPLNYSTHLKIDVHCSLKVKVKKNKIK